MRRKVKTIAGALCGICCVFLMGIGGKWTYGFFADAEQMENHFSAGYGTTEVTEEFPDPDPIIPGEPVIYKKRVSVTNENSVPAYVRVLVSCSDECLIPYMEYQELNEKDWVKHGVYYYYLDPVQPGEETRPLFEGVSISVPDQILLPRSEDFSIFCYEESVQIQHASVLFADYEEAWKFYLGGEL